MKNENYNGWTNRETWACSLNLRNDYNLNKPIEFYIKKAISIDELEFLLKTYVGTLYKLKVICPGSKFERIVEDIGAYEEINFKELAEEFYEEK